MNQPWITVVREDYWLILGKDRIEIAIAQPVRMFRGGLNGHQIHNVHHSNLDIRKMLTQQIDRRDRFQRWYIPGACHDHVRLGSMVRACPIPNSDAVAAMLDSR